MTFNPQELVKIKRFRGFFLFCLLLSPVIIFATPVGELALYIIQGVSSILSAKFLFVTAGQFCQTVVR